MTIKYYWHKGDKGHGFWRWIAWKLPDKLVYWASLRLIAYASQGEFSATDVPSLTAMDALKRWEQRNRGMDNGEANGRNREVERFPPSSYDNKCFLELVSFTRRCLDARHAHSKRDSRWTLANEIS